MIALAEVYAHKGKTVILSSRNQKNLENVQSSLTEITNKDKSFYPIECVDIEKDEVFKDVIEVFSVFPDSL